MWAKCQNKYILWHFCKSIHIFCLIFVIPYDVNLTWGGLWVGGGGRKKSLWAFWQRTKKLVVRHFFQQWEWFISSISSLCLGIRSVNRVAANGNTTFPALHAQEGFCPPTVPLGKGVVAGVFGSAWWETRLWLDMIRQHLTSVWGFVTCLCWIYLNNTTECLWS